MRPQEIRISESPKCIVVSVNREIVDIAEHGDPRHAELRDILNCLKDFYRCEVGDD